jgi:succinate dehydrogenase / fumarate reductase cytochrome b subunit
VQSSVAAPLAAPAPSFLSRHQFLIFRLFSLSGILPVGAYLCVHLLTNATILNGPQTFQDQVNKIHSLGVILPLVEWTFIFIPILFHAVVGLMIISGAMPNSSSYPYPGNIRYVLQRASALVLFFFILFHVWQMHHLGHSLGGGKFAPEHASSSTAAVLQSALWVPVCYVIGVLAAAYHFANGVWTFGITWGIWTSPAAQRRANWLSVAIGATLAVLGLGALWGMVSLNVHQARLVEDRMVQAEKMVSGEEPLPLPISPGSE